MTGKRGAVNPQRSQPIDRVTADALACWVGKGNTAETFDTRFFGTAGSLEDLEGTWVEHSRQPRFADTNGARLDEHLDIFITPTGLAAFWKVER